MTGDKEAFDFDAANIENLAVMQQYLSLWIVTCGSLYRR